MSTTIEERLRDLPESKADPTTLPSAAAILEERLKLLPVADTSLSELVKNLSKKKEDK